MLVKDRECLKCGSVRVKVITVCDGPAIGGEGRGVFFSKVQCVDCSFLFSIPILEVKLSKKDLTFFNNEAGMYWINMLELHSNIATAYEGLEDE